MLRVKFSAIGMAAVVCALLTSCVPPPPPATNPDLGKIRTIATDVAPYDVAVDGDGNVYFAEPSFHRVRKISPEGIITTVAGTGVYGTTGVGGPASSAQLFSPVFVDIDGSGNLYIGEYWMEGGRVLKVDAAGILSLVTVPYPFDGMAVDFDGNVYTQPYTGAGGPDVFGAPASYNFNRPNCVGAFDYGAYSTPGLTTHIAVGSDREVFVSENPGFDCGDVARVYKGTPDGQLSVTAGVGPRGFSGDGGAATAANLEYAGPLALDPKGNLFISSGARVRRVNTAGTITTVAGTGVSGFSGDLGDATSANIAAGYIDTDDAGNLYIAGGGRIRVVTLAP